MATFAEGESGSLKVLICTANMGNAEPTPSSMEAWIPKEGKCNQVTPLSGELSTGDGSTSQSFDIVVIGMQEATWKKRSENDLGLDEEDFDKLKLNVPSLTSSDYPKKKKNRASMKEYLEESVKRIADGNMSNPNAPDSALLRNMIDNILGTTYTNLIHFQRGQMRLFVFCHDSIKSQISDIGCTAENTGIAGVIANKGGIVGTITIRKTRLCFLTAHLAAHEGQDYCEARNDSVREILRGARIGDKYLKRHDASIVSHHMFVMGDLNYRVQFLEHEEDDMPKLEHEAHVQNALNLIDTKSWDVLYEADELQKNIANKNVLSQFHTLPCNFHPTFKVNRKQGYDYKHQRTPSYTDRILWTCADGLNKNLTPLCYEPCPDFITSDHKPIRGAFSIVPNVSNDVTTTTTTSPPVSLIFSNMSCKNLPAMDVSGASDPYIVFAWDPRNLLVDARSKKLRKKANSAFVSETKWPHTSFISKTLNPTWGEEKMLLATSSSHTTADDMNGSMLYISVYDYDISSADDYMGSIALNLRELVELKQHKKLDQPLMKYGKENGSIQFTLGVEETARSLAPTRSKKGFRGKMSFLRSKKVKELRSP